MNSSTLVKITVLVSVVALLYCFARVEQVGKNTPKYAADSGSFIRKER